jgi:Flp pilus assembly protein TadG
MRRGNWCASELESGRASLEFLVVAIFMVLPTMYLGLSLSSLQGASLATESAARNAVRGFVQETTQEKASQRALTAVTVALANHGFTQVALLERECSLTPCLSPGSVVTIRVGVEAPLFSTGLLPGPAGAPTRLVISEATGPVSNYGGEG